MDPAPLLPQKSRRPSKTPVGVLPGGVDAATRAVEGLRFLSETSAALAGSLDYEQTLNEIARRSVPLLADWCLVDMLEPDGRIRRVAGGHVDHRRTPLLHRLERDYPPSPAATHGVPDVLRTGRRAFHPRFTDEMLDEVARDAEHRALLRALGFRSHLCLPLVARGRTLGALSLMRGAHARPYDEDDLALGEELARRSALAIDNARLYAAEQRARAEAEAARHRIAFLAEASESLATSLDYEDTLKGVVRLALPHLADRCTIFRREEDGSVRLVTAAATDPAKVELLYELHRRYPITAGTRRPTPVLSVLNTGRSVVMSQTPESFIPALAEDEEHLRLLRALGFGQAMHVPLIARGRTIGVLTLSSVESGRQYSADDLALAEEVARRAAQALDNAQLYAAEQQARHAAERAADRTARLQAITAALSEALTPESAARVVVAQGIAALDGRNGAVVLLTDDGTAIEIVRAQGLPKPWVEHWRRTPLDAPVPMAEAVRTGQPLFFSTGDERFERYPALQVGTLRTRGASAILPLAVEGRVLGAMLLGFSEPRSFTPDEESFMLALAQQCAQALERTRLHEQEAAASAALEADRLKTELLNTVSHELRTPLAAIKGFTSTLLMYFDSLGREEHESFLHEISDASDRLQELVDNLLRLSRLESGTLPLRFEPAQVGPLLRHAVELARQTHPNRVFHIDAPDDLPAVHADARRLGQVLANLLDNAVKYSPSGDAIEVQARAATESISISVTDHGIGIAPEHHERIFERFYRVEHGPARDIGGTGLGLAICRHIVDAHGGSVSVSSAEGMGATFTIRLPLYHTMGSAD